MKADDCKLANELSAGIEQSRSSIKVKVAFCHTGLVGNVRNADVEIEADHTYQAVDLDETENVDLKVKVTNSYKGDG